MSARIDQWSMLGMMTKKKKKTNRVMGRVRIRVSSLLSV